MKEKRRLTQEAFDRLLAWLDPDPVKAGDKYVEIRHRVIKVFVRRGCTNAEELADETMDRVTVKVAEIADDYEGDPVAYFCGVAGKVFLESVKPRPAPPFVPLPDVTEDAEERLKCLDDCLARLDQESRDLILEYYRDEKRTKIDRHKEMAAGFSISINTLRMRAHRIKTGLRRCVQDCLGHVQAGTGYVSPKTPYQSEARITGKE